MRTKSVPKDMKFERFTTNRGAYGGMGQNHRQENAEFDGRRASANYRGFTPKPRHNMERRLELIALFLLLLVGCKPNINSKNQGESLRALDAITQPSELVKITINNRHKAVRLAALERVTHQDDLIEIALNSYDDDVSPAATAKLKTQDAIAQVAGRGSRSARELALSLLEDQELLTTIAKNERLSIDARLSATAKITNQSELIEIASGLQDGRLMAAAITAMNQETLARFVTRTSDWQRALPALVELSDQSLLAKVAAFHSNERVRRDASTQISNPHALVFVAIHGFTREDRVGAASRLKEERWNFVVAVSGTSGRKLVRNLHAPDGEVMDPDACEIALQGINSQEMLAAVATDAIDYWIARSALRRLTDESLLPKVIVECAAASKEFLCDEALNRLRVETLDRCMAQKDDQELASAANIVRMAQSAVTGVNFRDESNKREHLVRIIAVLRGLALPHVASELGSVLSASVGRTPISAQYGDRDISGRPSHSLGGEVVTYAIQMNNPDRWLRKTWATELPKSAGFSPGEQGRYESAPVSFTSLVEEVFGGLSKEGWQKLLSDKDRNLHSAAMARAEDPSLLAKTAIEAREWEFRMGGNAVGFVEDQALLRDIVMQAKCAPVRIAAIRKLSDYELLSVLSKEAEDHEIRKAATARLKAAEFRR